MGGEREGQGGIDEETLDLCSGSPGIGTDAPTLLSGKSSPEMPHVIQPVKIWKPSFHLGHSDDGTQRVLGGVLGFWPTPSFC